MPRFLYQTLPVRHAGNPIIANSPSSWFATNVFDPVVMVSPWNSNELLMYTSGQEDPVSSGIMSIGLFTTSRSTPLGPWVEYGQILEGSGSGWDGEQVRLCQGWYFDGTKLWLMYTGYPIGTLVGGAIGLMSSTDGRNFTRYASNPVLTATGNGRNDGDIVSELGWRRLANGTFVGLYSYRDTAHSPAIVLPGFRAATATALTSWTKAGSGDVLSDTNVFNEDKQMLAFGDTSVILFDKGSDTTAWAEYIATATSPTGTYTLTAESPILQASGTVGAFDRYGVSTAYLVKFDGTWYLYFSGAGEHLAPYSSNHWQLGVAVYAALAITTFQFDAGKALLTDSAADVWASGTIKARLVDASVEPLITDATINGYTAIGTDVTLSSKTKTVDGTNHYIVWSAANATLTGAASSQNYGSVVVYKLVNDDTDSVPLFCIAKSGTTDGTDLFFAWNSTTGIGVMRS